MKILSKPGGILLACALIFSASACGTGPTTSATAAKALSGDDLQGVVDKATANIKKYTAITGQDIELPKGEPFKPGQAKAMVISCGQASAVCVEFTRGAVEAAKAAGWTVPPIKDAEFASDKVAGFVNEAVNQNYNVIIYAGANANDVVSAVKRAAAAGIVQVGYNTPSEDAIKDDVIPITPDYQMRGSLIADWVISKSKCTGEPVHLFEDPAYASTMAQLAATKSRLAECGASLEVKTKKVATTDLSKPGPPFWTAELAQNPRGKMPFVISPYDTMAAPMARTTADQKRDDIALTGIDGTPEVVGMIQKGTIAMTVTSPWEYMAYVSVDLAARKLTGQPLYDATKITGRAIVQENADAFTNYWVPKDVDYKSAFAKRWSGK